MSNPSNLYAEKVFAEHPTGLWALDDKADYISIIDVIMFNDVETISKFLNEDYFL
jgi:hypothetical protein